MNYGVLKRNRRKSAVLLSYETEWQMTTYLNGHYEYMDGKRRLVKV